MAEAFKGLSDTNSPNDVLQKLKIRLVSNQPIARNLRDALEAAQSVLCKAGLAKVTTSQLLKQLSGPQANIAQKLGAAAGLSSSAFTDFLRVLDLSKLAQGSRQLQRLALIQELSPLVSNDPVASLRSLCDLIREEAQPNRSNSLGLAEHDILAALEVSNRENLFPAPPHFEQLSKPIPTVDASHLAKLIAGATSNAVVAHGAAGTGKTTTIQQLKEHLPAGSELILYDCFGGGSYKIPGEQRHLQRRAFRQLTNELALTCGTPFLVKPADDIPDLQKDFTRSLDMAAKVVGVTKGALLVIVVDAADNAAIAARDDKDNFVPVLWQIPLPNNCRLVMTCRTHRRDLLHAPPSAVEYELNGFDKNASSMHLHTKLRLADENSCLEFHNRTGGNPRMQSYLLSKVTPDSAAAATMTDLFAGKRETLDEMFNDLLQAAIVESSENVDSKTLLADLMCLTRPVPLEILAEIHQLSSDLVKNFCRALEPGLVRDRDAVWFRDEDFEDFLLRQITTQETKDSHKRISRWFLSDPNKTSYSAQYLAEHLFQGELFSELIDVAVDGPDPGGVTDEITRVEVQRRRINLAMDAACQSKNDLGSLKLLFVAAEADRINNALATVLHNDLDLAIEFGNSSNAIRIFLRDNDFESPASAHLRIATICSRIESEQERALDNLNLGRAWLRRKFSNPATLSWKVSTTDIAREAECVFWLYGPEEALRTIRRWRPRSAQLDAAAILARSLANYIPTKTLEKELRKLRLPALANAVILSALWDKGLHPSRLLANSTSAVIENFLRKRPTTEGTSSDLFDRPSWALSFCELLAAAGLPRQRVVYLAGRLCQPEVIRLAPRYTFEEEFHHQPLKKYCLWSALNRKHLNVEDLMPPDLRSTDNSSRNTDREPERRRFAQTVDKILPIYGLRASSIVRRKTATTILSGIRSDLDGGFRESYPINLAFLFRPWARAACETILRCKADATGILERIASEAESTIGIQSPEVFEDLASKLSRSKQYRDQAQCLLDRAATFVMEHPFSGRERSEHLLTCASISNRFDYDSASDYYKRAVAAAEGIDDDLIPLLSFYCNSAKRLIGLTKEEAQELAARIARLVESHRDYVPEEARHLYNKTIDTTTRLSPSDGFALCSRWDDDGFCEIDQGVRSLASAATSIAYLTPLEGLAMLRLAGEEYDLTNEALPILDLINDKGAPARPELLEGCAFVSDWIQRHLSLSNKKTASERVVDWAKTKGLSSLPSVRALEERLQFISSSRADPQSEPSPWAKDDVNEAELKQLLREAKQGSLESFEDRVIKVRRIEYGAHIDEFLRLLGESIKQNDRVEFLARMVKAANDDSLARQSVEPFLSFVSKWRHQTTVEKKTQALVAGFIEAGLVALIKRGYGETDLLRRLTSVLQSESRSSVLFTAIVKHQERLGPRDLYACAELLCELAPQDVAFNGIKWSLRRTENHFSSHNRPLAPISQPTLLESSAGTLAYFLFAVFGHINKRIRWRALHAARHIIELPNKKLADEFTKVATLSSVGPFRSPDKRLEFYPMSALSWLMLCFDRVAGERPEFLKEQLDFLAAQAIDTNFPHAQIREFARRAAVKVIQSFPESLPKERRQQLGFANQPTVCNYPRQSKYTANPPRNLHFSEPDSACFTFDMIDTIPYWIQPLADVFGSHTDDVSARVRNWICNHWGRTDADWHNDLRRRLNEHRWHLMSKRHGSIPTIENLHTYLEYHGLLCAAGQMVDENVPVSVDTYDDPDWPWEDWLSRHVSSNDTWLSDLRRPTPLLKECWGIWPTLENWQEKSLADYDIGLGFNEPGHQNEIVVAGYIDLWDRDRQGSYHIESALVNSEAAYSLLSALQTTKNPHDFSLEHAINKPGFQLSSWYEEERFSRGLDRFDPLVRIDLENYTIPSNAFLREMDLRRVPRTIEFRSAAGHKSVWLEIWSDQTEEHHQEIRSAFSDGQRLWIDREVLIEYLNRIGRDLILEVKLARNSRLDGAKHEFGTSRIYLLRRNGRLETLAGNREIGRADRN
jgi:hypothetical protein